MVILSERQSELDGRRMFVSLEMERMVLIERF